MFCSNNKRLSKKIITILPIAAIIYLHVKAIMIWVDGKTGELIHKKTFGVAAMSSPQLYQWCTDGNL